MACVTGGRTVVDSLRAAGVKHVFGLIGSATLEIFDALCDDEEIEFVAVHDEWAGAHMADGYARASRNASVVLAGQNGPGATNIVSGLVRAKAAFSPLVSLAGALSSEN